MTDFEAPTAMDFSVGSTEQKMAMSLGTCFFMCLRETVIVIEFLLCL